MVQKVPRQLLLVFFLFKDFIVFYYAYEWFATVCLIPQNWS